MKLLISYLLLLSVCEQPTQKEEKIVNTDTNFVSVIEDKQITKDTTNDNKAADTSIVQTTIKFLALTSNALQLVNSNTGSTSQIAFGKPLEELVEITNKILQEKVSSIGVNSECGAGPLKMALWKNGLNLIFKEQKADGLWQFVGWYVSKPKNNTKTLQTMAGIGIGSTREEIESAYDITITKLNLGSEFATTSGLYGIFDGAGKNAKITDMWSGTTCVFR